MPSVRTMISVVAFLSAVGLAQSPQSDQTLPPGFDATSSGFTSNAPFNATVGMILQYGYQSSLLAYHEPQRIDSISFRQAAGFHQGGPIATTIFLGSLAVDVGGMSQTFGANRDADFTAVYTGPINWTAGVIAPPGQWVTVVLPVPFPFDGSTGKDLLIEVRTTAGAPFGAATIESGFGGVRTIAHTSNPNALLANQDLVTAALVRIHTTAVATFSITSSGPGVGDLTMSLTNLPAGTTQGWCLISTFALAPINTGPVLGIYPTQSTIDVLYTAPIAGNPLAWIAGVPPGNFPTDPLVLPPGTLVFLSGQVWDAVAICLSPSFTFLGRSNVQRVVF